MEKLYNLLTGILLLAAVACNDDDYSVYDTSESRLNFLFYNADSSVVAVADVTDIMRRRSFSFVLESAIDADKDTVWLDASTMGFLSNEARPFALEQIQMEGVKNAEPGVHYVAFDDPDVISLYRVEAWQHRVRIPVIVLRGNADLQDTTVVLKIGFKDNGYFKPGYEGIDTRTVEITDRLSQPENWYTAYYLSHYSLANFIGHYGELKHRLMINWTGKAWDAAYIEEFLKGDAAFVTYMSTWLAKRLKEENTTRLAAGQEKYKEKDGTEVDFSSDWSI